MKGISRSRATLIFSMGVPILKPLRGSRRTGFLLLGRPSLDVQTPCILCYVYEDHSANV